MLNRKDADQEFFQMTLLAQIMTHKKQSQLIEMQAETERLFQRCKQSGQPFFNWPEWIRNHIETQLTMYQDFKRNRLAKIFQQGKKMLFERTASRTSQSKSPRLLKRE